jgi:hypothetical protein
MRVRFSTLFGAVAGAAALLVPAGCATQDPAPAGASAVATPSGTSTSVPSPAVSPPASPAAAARPSKTSPARPAAAPKPARNGCPVRASTLQKAAKLPRGYKIDAASIKCKQNWAISGLVAPSPDMQGDGVVFFKYEAGTGTWRKMGEGSQVQCGDGDPMGVPESTGFCRPAS